MTPSMDERYVGIPQSSRLRDVGMGRPPDNGVPDVGIVGPLEGWVNDWLYRHSCNWNMTPLAKGALEGKSREQDAALARAEANVRALSDALEPFAELNITGLSFLDELIVAARAALAAVKQ